MSNPIYEIRDLSFSYSVGDRTVRVLEKLNLNVNQGDFIGIQGPSGSGKSTLFYILGFLLRPSSGLVLLDGRNITHYDDDELTVLRNSKIGFIFQQFHLLSKTTALENILIPTQYPLEISRTEQKDKDRAHALADRLGISQHERC
jgi:putative ABC transport system ATP-binding protein